MNNNDFYKNQVVPGVRISEHTKKYLDTTANKYKNNANTSRIYKPNKKNTKTANRRSSSQNSAEKKSLSETKSSYERRRSSETKSSSEKRRFYASAERRRIINEKYKTRKMLAGIKNAYPLIQNNNVPLKNIGNRKSNGTPLISEVD